MYIYIHIYISKLGGRERPGSHCRRGRYCLQRSDVMISIKILSFTEYSKVDVQVDVRKRYS